MDLNRLYKSPRYPSWMQLDRGFTVDDITLQQKAGNAGNRC